MVKPPNGEQTLASGLRHTTIPVVPVERPAVLATSDPIRKDADVIDTSDTIRKDADAHLVDPPLVRADALADVKRGGVVRCLTHLDDSADSGKYYMPGEVIEGWADEKIARLAAAEIVRVED